MKTREKAEYFMFFGILLVFGVVFVAGSRFIKEEQTKGIIRHFVEETSNAQVQAPSTTLVVAKDVHAPAVTAESSSSQNTLAIPLSIPAPPPPTPPAPPTPESVAAPTVSTHDRTLPYSVGIFNDSFGDGDGWINWWGSSASSGGVLTIGANASTTGGGALLSGSGSWSDFTFQATVDWNQGETFGMVARYVDSDNYLVCQFDEKYVGDVHLRLDEHVKGVVTHLADGDILNYNQMGGNGLITAIQVRGNQGTCAFNGYTVSSEIDSNVIDPSLSKGEIGFTTWDPTVDNSTIVVRNVGVVKDIYILGSHAAPRGI